ncbi:hypothetical protein RAA17_02510 [Komagataeibacter rhaeticus]|nr:hypothetical protein [Komagataeibacter rhaeticus]
MPPCILQCRKQGGVWRGPFLHALHGQGQARAPAGVRLAFDRERPVGGQARKDAGQAFLRCLGVA